MKQIPRLLSLHQATFTRRRPLIKNGLSYLDWLKILLSEYNQKTGILMFILSAAKEMKSVVVLTVLITEDFKPEHAREERASDGMFKHLMNIQILIHHH